jgi:hypothetical protein
VSRRRERTDFHRLDEAVFDGETVDHVFITKDDPAKVAHNLMDFDLDSPGPLWMKRNRFDVRINLGPLLRPVSPNLFMTTNDATLKRSRPCHVGRHGGESGVEVPGVKRSVSRAEQFNFRRRLIWHDELQQVKGDMLR